MGNNQTPAITMNGAESLVRTLVANGVDTCFTNPGTSEMHFVAALDKVAGLRSILGLFEGVVTGAADGYFRMADKPAATLLHLGPGLGNGLANLHNAKKAGSGIVNIVGEHATYHLRCNAPLTADVEGIARPVSNWVRTTTNSRSVAADGAECIAAARQGGGQIATLVLPADAAWGPAEDVALARAADPGRTADPPSIAAAASSLKLGKRSALLLGGRAVREEALDLAGRIAAVTGCSILSENNLPRLQRGAGRVQTVRIPYAVDAAQALLAQFDDLVLVGSKAPVAFFAYPGKPSLLARPGSAVHELASGLDNVRATLEELAEHLGARRNAPFGVAPPQRPELPGGALTPEGIGAVLGALIPEGAIVVDESVTTGRSFDQWTAGAPPHDWLNIVGGSIGFGLPAAVGAAVAAPGRPVIALEGDGSAMYTLQALWTMARESLNVNVIVFANRKYRILEREFANVGAGEPGTSATNMLNIDRPALDWQALARGHGVDAGIAFDLDGLAVQLRRALASSGPYLIEVAMGQAR